MFYKRFFYWKNERISHFLFFGEQCEWIAQVAHQKWAMRANRSGSSPKMSDHVRFAPDAQRKWAIVSELLRSLTKKWTEDLTSGIWWTEDPLGFAGPRTLWVQMGQGPHLCMGSDEPEDLTSGFRWTEDLTTIGWTNENILPALGICLLSILCTAHCSVQCTLYITLNTVHKIA